jgi:hypothetical protein
VHNPGTIVINIPEKILASKQYDDRSDVIHKRTEGFQRFLNYLMNHPVLCASPDLSKFLTSPKHEFEHYQNLMVTEMSKSDLNILMQNVFLDGKGLLKIIDPTPKSYMVESIKSTAKGIK